MAEVRACDVPGSWRFFLYVSALCGCSNVYRCCWVPRWLRWLSTIYQIIMLAIYLILVGVALAEPGPSRSLHWTINRYSFLLLYVIIILLTVVILWQTYFGSGLFVLFQTWKTFQTRTAYTVKHKLWRRIVILTVALVAIIIDLILVACTLWKFMEDGVVPGALYLFPAMDGHTTRDLLFGVDAMFRVLAIMFVCSYMLLCFVVVVDLTFLFSSLKEDMEDIFSATIVDAFAVEKCLSTMRGICKLVDAANGTFGVSLAIYLMWIVPTIIYSVFQLVQYQERILIRMLASFAFVFEILILILVPPAVMAAQVNYLLDHYICYTPLNLSKDVAYYIKKLKECKKLKYLCNL